MKWYQSYFSIITLLLLIVPLWVVFVSSTVTKKFIITKLSINRTFLSIILFFNSTSEFLKTAIEHICGSVFVKKEEELSHDKFFHLEFLFTPTYSWMVYVSFFYFFYFIFIFLITLKISKAEK